MKPEQRSSIAAEQYPVLAQEVSWKGRLGALFMVVATFLAISLLVPWPAQAVEDNKAPCPINDSGQNQCGGDDDHERPDGPGDLGTCTIPAHGGNPCDKDKDGPGDLSDRPDDDDDHPGDGPDDFADCTSPTHGGNSCDKDRPGDGGGGGGDGGGGGGDRPGDGDDRPGDGDGGGGRNTGGRIVVPNRVDAGGGGTAGGGSPLVLIGLGAATAAGIAAAAAFGRIPAQERQSR